MTGIDPNPDGPWSPERAREVAARFAEDARLLNYATQPGCDALDDPADLAAVAGDVYVAVTRLIQFFGQVHHIVGTHADDWEPDSPDLMGAVASARAWADDARTECVPFSDVLVGLHQRLSHLRVKEAHDP